MSTRLHYLVRSPPVSRIGRVRGARRGLVAAIVALLAAGCRDAVSPLEERAPAVLAPTAPAAVLAGVTAIDLLAGQPPGTYTDVRGLNDLGWATGSRFLGTVDEWRPYRWKPSTGFQAITGICCGSAWGADINDAGVIVGRAQTAVNQGHRAFFASGTTMIDLGLLPGVSGEYASSDAVAISDGGGIAGWSNTIAGPPHAVIWRPWLQPAIQDLGTLGGAYSVAIDINASSQVIGMSDIVGAGQRAFIWSPANGIQDLSNIVGYTVVPAAINDAGQIAGRYDAANDESHAFLYTPGSGLRDLGTLGGDSSDATGLNNNGQVVGNSKTASGLWHAFLWTLEDGMEDVTAISGFDSLRKLNVRLQTLSGPLMSVYGRPYVLTLNVRHYWPFSGFANPIQNPPAWNTAQAGRTVVLFFALGGDHGLGIFAAGSPSTVEVSCATGATSGATTPLSPDDFELRYQPDAARYALRWKTSSGWAGSCRQLTLQLVDGSTHTARFTFR